MTRKVCAIAVEAQSSVRGSILTSRIPNIHSTESVKVPPRPFFFFSLAINSFPSVMANRVSPVKSTTFPIGRLWKKVRAACCHVSHAKAPRHLFVPPGTQPPRTAGLFWRSAGWERADVGVHGGGWDYRWAVGGVGGCRTE